MSDTGGAIPTISRSSNRAPLQLDGTTASAYLQAGVGLVTTPLLVTLTRKRIKFQRPVTVQNRASVDPTAVDGMGNPVFPAAAAGTSTVYEPFVAESVFVKNQSGQACELTFVTELNEDGGSQLEESLQPITLANNESITINARVVAVVEYNAGAGTQTGKGVIYVIQPETKRP